MRKPALKRLFFVLALLAALGAVFSFAYTRKSSIVAKSDSLIQEVRETPRTVPVVRIGDTEIAVELATTSAAVQKGLSGRSSLDPERGMLFIFQKPDRYRFWMPDMHFPIDIIWIEGGKVLGIDADVSPDFNPANPRFYMPPRPVRYVLEVHAGFARSRTIAVGDAVAFRLGE